MPKRIWDAEKGHSVAKSTYYRHLQLARLAAHLAQSDSDEEARAQDDPQGSNDEAVQAGPSADIASGSPHAHQRDDELGPGEDISSDWDLQLDGEHDADDSLSGGHRRSSADADASDSGSSHGDADHWGGSDSSANEADPDAEVEFPAELAPAAQSDVPAAAASDFDSTGAVAGELQDRDFFRHGEVPTLILLSCGAAQPAGGRELLQPKEVLLLLAK